MSLFKLWSETNTEVKNELKPNFDFRNWDDLDSNEKETIWHYLMGDFYPYLSNTFLEEDVNKVFYNTIDNLNETYKHKSYGQNFLKSRSTKNAIDDFKNIYYNQNQNVFFELLSFFSLELIGLSEAHTYKVSKSKNESENDFRTRQNYYVLDVFKDRLNNIFEQFKINIILERQGWIPRQEKIIMEEVYDPVLKFLSANTWKDVNRELKEAFNNYHKATPEGYSGSINHAIVALEAFLQIKLHGKTGKGTLSSLLTEAILKNVIPNDPFSKQIFNNVESILMQERKKSANAHPKEEYGTERIARLVLNISMIFMQHCI